MLNFIFLAGMSVNVTLQVYIGPKNINSVKKTRINYTLAPRSLPKRTERFPIKLSVNRQKFPPSKVRSSPDKDTGLSGLSSVQRYMCGPREWAVFYIR